MKEVKAILGNMWLQAKLIIPKLLGTLAILIIGYIVAKIIKSIVYKLLNKININKLGEKLNDIDFIRKSNYEVAFDKIISKLLYYIILLITFMTASSYLGVDAISNLITDIINYIPRLFSGAIILILGLLVANFIKSIIESTLKSMSIPSAKMIANAIFYFIFVSVLMSALKQAQIDISILNNNLSIIIGGVALAFAIGYGFAAKDVFSNHLTSMSIKNKYVVGDIIEVEGTRGEIIKIDSTSVVLKEEDKQVSFPLAVLTNKKITLYKN